MTQFTTLLGIDTGGTFTDFVALSSDQALKVHKVLSTPSAPDQAILQGIREMDLMAEVEAGRVIIVHGTTVATNATLEGKGAKTVYITNQGLKDTLAIGRQTRTQLYNLTPSLSPSLTSQTLVLEVACRIDAKGRIVEPLTEASLVQLSKALAELKPEAVAVNLLFSYLNDSHEQTIKAHLDSRLFVSCSSEVLPEYKEYERGVVTWLNAFLGPLISRYMQSLAAAITPSKLSIMQSSGLTIAAEQAADKAVNLLLSGPVGGISAAAFMGRRSGNQALMTFDMGGTSTDVSLYHGAFRLTTEGKINALPIAVPMVDIHTIGAGGGSIASVDPGGLLQVGPASAGAVPGPACYDQGGTVATVTDANLLAGRLLPGQFLGGRMQLSLQAAANAVNTVASELGTTMEETTLGIIALANAHMSQALRVISIEKGENPQDYVLVSFGGAGALHICELAESLEMTEAMIPLHGGIFSALGMLTTPTGRSLSRTLQVVLDRDANDLLVSQFDALKHQALASLTLEGVTAEHLTTEASADLRYQGQTFTLNIPWQPDADLDELFHQRHQARYGHRLDKPVELLNLRLRVHGPIPTMELPKLISTIETPQPVGESVVLTSDPGGMPTRVTAPIFRRDTLKPGYRLSGPMIITEDHATSWIQSGWTINLDEVGNIRVSKTKKPT